MARPIKNETESIIDNLRPEQKRAFALKLLQETDPDVIEAVHLAEQEKETQHKIDMSLKDEETRQRNEKHYWIEVNRMGPDDSETHVFVGAAGVSYQLQKDVAVPVPKSVLDVLDNAIITGFVPIIDEGLGVKFLKPIKYKRYPYSRLGEATPEEVENFRADQENKRRASEDMVLGQEMARARLTEDSIAHQEVPFVPAYLKPEAQH